ncbi:alpha/beta fold hydrolase [Nocardiopsis alkaliphila]|uniref:alpha/beta fold hydrolase n=1 Tax=Nocardiopsis alkaliphila TaxID=225762 RepID=UPI00034CFB28|nr:alpha/beta hydrolase [Nocardiopsis alkaliphila]
MERTIQKRVEVDDGWITVDIYGDPDGPALIMVPGVMADAAAWADVARHLGAWRTVAIVNRRGRWPSAPLAPTYSLRTELDDVAMVLRDFSDVRVLFGWSYGGLIALHLANTRTVPHVIAYEPVMHPFGAHALPLLRRAHDDADFDAVVELVLGRIAGMDEDTVGALRGNDSVWGELRRLGRPVHAETVAIDEAPQPAELATGAERVDLIIGELNRGRAPYGTSFDDVARHVFDATVHELGGQGHLAHLEAPAHLATLINGLGTPLTDRFVRESTGHGDGPRTAESTGPDSHYWPA